MLLYSRLGTRSLTVVFQIIRKALSDIEYVRSLQGRLGRLVTEAYVRCLTYTHGMYTSTETTLSLPQC